MLEKIKRAIESLKWLFNHPPTIITLSDPSDDIHCDYCSNTKSLWDYGSVTICKNCRKKVYDAVLLNKDNNNE